MGRPKNPPKRKYSHSEIQDVVAVYLMTAGRIRIVCKESKSKLKEVPDIFAVDRQGTYMVEVKVSHKDFLADNRKTFRRRPKEGVGKWRYYACPEGIIQPEEVPPRWGLIYVYEDGRVGIVKGKKFPREPDEGRYTFQQNFELEYWELYAMLRKAVSWGMGSDGVWKYNKEDFLSKEDYYTIGEDPEQEAVQIMYDVMGGELDDEEYNEEE